LVLSADDARNKIRSECISARGERIFYLADAFRLGMTLEEVFDLSKVDPWFLAQIQDIVSSEMQINGLNVADIDADEMFGLKRKGFSDVRLADLLCCSEQAVRERRKALKIKPVFKRVDSCAAEFDTQTAYLYSTYQQQCEANPTDKKKIMILGGGPNRIGQGIEFDYCCVHASLALREDGFETIQLIMTFQIVCILNHSH